MEKPYKFGIRSLSEIQNNFSQNTTNRMKDPFDLTIGPIDDRLEQESNILIGTFNETFRRVFKTKFLFGMMDIEPEELDYSQLITPLAKVVETEINLSLVQWIRQSQGIEMPEYFNKVKPDNNILFENVVDLNRNYNGRLCGLTLGQACTITSKMYQDGKYPHEIKNPGDFIEQWKVINIYRNSASHSGRTQQEDFKKFYVAFSLLLSMGVFSELMDIKERLSR